MNNYPKWIEINLIDHNHLELDYYDKDIIVIDDNDIRMSIDWWYEAKIMNKIHQWWKCYRDIKRQRYILRK